MRLALRPTFVSKSRIKLSLFFGMGLFLVAACGGGSESSAPAPQPVPPPSNTDPSPVADSALTVNSAPVTVAVLNNDSDADGDTLTLDTIATSPQFGNAVIDGNNIVYTPNEYFLGADTFEYQVSDGQSTATAVVNISNTQQFSLTGNVSNLGANVENVVLSLDGQELTSQPDSAGEYTFAVTLEAPVELITVRTESQSTFVEWASVIGDSASLFERTRKQQLDAFSAAILPNLRLNEVNTAFYLHFVNARAKNELVSLTSVVQELSGSDLFDWAAFLRVLTLQPDLPVPQNTSVLDYFADVELQTFELVNQLYESANLMDQNGELLWSFVTSRENAKKALALEAETLQAPTFAQDDEVYWIKLVMQNGYFDLNQAVIAFLSEQSGIESSFYSNNSNTLFSESFSWEEDESGITMIYTEGNERVQYPFVDLAYIAAIWGDEVATFYMLNPKNSQMTIETRKSEASLHSLAEFQNTRLVSEKLIEELTLVYDEDTEFVAYQQKNQLVVLHKVTEKIAFTNDELAGQSWVLPSHIEREYAIDSDVLLVETLEALDIWNLSVNGAAIGESGVAGQWSLSNGELMLQHGTIKTKISKVLNSPIGTLALILTTDASDEVPPLVYAKEIYKTDYASVDGLSLVTELPFAWQAHFDAANSEFWQGRPFNVDFVFAWKFENNDKLGRIYPSTTSGETYFTNDRNRYDWKLVRDGSRLKMNGQRNINDEPYFLYQRNWVLVGTLGPDHFKVFDYGLISYSSLVDGNFDTNLSVVPRLTTMKKVDLSQFEEVWANTLARGSLNSTPAPQPVNLSLDTIH